MSLLPKFLRTKVLGITTPSSTQQTLIFQWPTSTTNAELTAVPKQAMTLSKWMYSFLKPMREKIECTSILICLLTKMSGTTNMQLKEVHSFSGIFILFLRMQTKIFYKSEMRSLYSCSPSMLSPPCVITFRKIQLGLVQTLKASSPKRIGAAGLQTGILSMLTTCLALGLPLKGRLSILITPYPFRFSSILKQFSLNQSQSNYSSSSFSSILGLVRLQAMKGETENGTFQLAKLILMEWEPSCSTMALLPLSSSLQMKSLLACRFFMVFCMASLDQVMVLFINYA